MNLAKTARLLIAFVALVWLSGCVSDLGSATGETPAAHQLRYYGGPKNPMWPGQ